MRIKDEQKIAKVKQACVDLTFELGVEGISAGKLAKRSNVSASNIYIYFKNMHDMLQVINKEITWNYFNSISKVLATEKTVEENFFALWDAAYQYCTRHPKEFMFTTRMVHSCIVDHTDESHLEPCQETLPKFLEKGIQKKQIKKVSVRSFIHIAFTPFYGMLKASIENGVMSLDEETKALLRTAAWDAIRL
ncbi:TetR/AcrR family transcriptional regulator [Fulvivirgaceae bacterium BMA12]|uniref:TetR/AcrR family transcriptional regulator n=1 Tax=Agaribacillus aureus TaxID=3051825 RepID=A0ABT8LC40_9BACT|nr:TetR/AcrR family transcriptional regulator [Fulvivirgaceae bacterium BMA12]